MSESNIMLYVIGLFTFFQWAYVISLQYILSFTNFSRALYRMMQIYLTHSFLYQKPVVVKG